MNIAIWPIAIGMGIIDAILLFIFELIGVDLTAWVWNDVFQTAAIRWLLIPVAILLGLGLTLVMKAFRVSRFQPIEDSLMAEVTQPPRTLYAIWAILAVGAVSLLAGASLGPEAALMSASAGIGAYMARRFKKGSLSQVLVLSSIGALLVAFVGSPLLVLVPILFMIQEARKQNTPIKKLLPKLLIPVLAGVASYATLELLNALTGKSGGYGSFPSLPHFSTHDIAMAVVVGFVTSGLAAVLMWLIAQFSHFSQWLSSKKIPAKDWLLGIGFATVLGGIYLLGGQTIEFSGTIGTGLLAHEGGILGIAALSVLIVSKLLATAWSKGTGYRGGLVFPSIYVGLALGLLVSNLSPALGGIGAILGAIAGILTAVVGAPVIAGIFLIAFLPFAWNWTTLAEYAVVLSAIIGTLLYKWLWTYLMRKKGQQK